MINQRIPRKDVEKVMEAAGFKCSWKKSSMEESMICRE